MAILDVDLATPPCHAHARQQQPHADEQQDTGSEEEEQLLLKGVRHLCERGTITKLPARYVLPPSDCPSTGGDQPRSNSSIFPVIDLARLRAPSERAAALAELDAACRDYDIFQVVGQPSGGGGRSPVEELAALVAYPGGGVRD